MLIPSGSLWIDLDRRAGRARGSPGRRRPPDPFAQSRTIRRPARGDRRGRARGGARGSARGAPGSTTDRPISALPTEPSSSVRQISCSISSSTPSSSLRPVLVEDLQAVVVGRVVGRRDHDPGGEVAGPGEEREGRRRDAAGDPDVGAEARRAGRDRRDEHVAGAARVLADDERARRARRAGGRSPGRARRRASA